MTIIRAESRFPRLLERARIRHRHRLPKHRVNGPQIPEHVIPDFWPPDPSLVRHAWRAVGLLFLACVVLPMSIGIGRAITSIVVSAVWG